MLPTHVAHFISNIYIFKYLVTWDVDQSLNAFASGHLFRMISQKRVFNSFHLLIIEMKEWFTILGIFFIIGLLALVAKDDECY